MKAIVLVLIILTQYAKSITWLRGDGTLYASHCDFRNNDIGLARTNYWQCGPACRSFPGCTRFAWSLDNGGTCYFKSGSASISDAVEISNDNRGLICGILTFDEIRWEEESGFQWARMCDFKNNDLGVVRASDRNKCADSCRNFNGCTRFAWNLANGGSCYLKSGPRNVDDAILNNKDSGLICGIIKAANASTDDLGECQKVFCQSMLDRHNTYRTQHGVGNLKIDQTISTSAQEWSENLASLRQFFHSNGKYGENLAMFWSTNLAATVETCKDLGGRMTDLWYNEIDKYNFTNPGFSMETGHFTQVVWKSSQRIGCGISNNGSEFYGVAQYDPPGNFIGQFEQNVPKKIA